MQLRALSEFARRRWRKVMPSAISAVQVGVAAGIAWWLAGLWLPGSQPFYAPIGAVVAIGAGENRLADRSVHLMVGMLTAVAGAGLAVRWIGTGPWQIVVLTVATTVLGRYVSDDALVRSYASLYGALIGAIGASGLLPDRLLEAALGATCGLVVSHVLFPPRVDRVILDPLGEAAGLTRRALREAAAALRAGESRALDAPRQSAATAEARLAANDHRQRFARQLVRLSPMRWREGEVAAGAIAVDRTLTPVLLDAVGLARGAIRVASRHDRPAPAGARPLELVESALGEVLKAVDHPGGDLGSRARRYCHSMPTGPPGDRRLQMLAEEARQVAQSLAEAVGELESRRTVAGSDRGGQ